MANFIPHPKKQTEERIEDILRDLETSIDNGNICTQSFKTILSRIKSSKHPLYQFKRFDTSLQHIIHLINEDTADSLCLIVLKNINFNLNYIIHKQNIHEKQNIRINYSEMVERVCMPNLKQCISKLLSAKKLSLSKNSIRLFVTYFLLDDSVSLERVMSFEDIYRECCALSDTRMDKKGKEDGCVSKTDEIQRGCENNTKFNNNEITTPRELNNEITTHRELNNEITTPKEHNDSSHDKCNKFNLSIENESTVNNSTNLNESYGDNPQEKDGFTFDEPYFPTFHSKTLVPVSTPYEYLDSHKTFYFLQYVLTGNQNVLINWLLKGREDCDWSYLGLPIMNDFVFNELRFVKDTSFIYSIVLQCRSHSILSRFILKILFKMGFSRSLHILVLSSFDLEKLEDTIVLLKKLYREDIPKTNRILRDLIVGYSPPALQPLFFAYYSTLDLNYFECLRVYIPTLSTLPRTKLAKVIESEFFPLLIEDIDQFCFVLDVAEKNNLLKETVSALKKVKWECSSVNLEKLKHIYKNYPVDKSLFLEETKLMIKKLYKGKRQEEEYNCTINGLREKDTTRINRNASVCNCTGPKQTSRNDTTLFSLVSNVSTIEEVFKVDFYKKKYKIKKDRRSRSCPNAIYSLIDFIFIYRNELLDKSDLKKVYKLDTCYFLKNLKENSVEDVFFSRALRVALRRSKEEMSLWVSTLPFYKEDDYWSVALRRSIKLKGNRGGEMNRDKEMNKDKEMNRDKEINGNKKEYRLQSKGSSPPSYLSPSSPNTPYLISNSILRDSYLDLSQINESKLIIESRVEIEKILEDGSLSNTRDNPEVRLRKRIPSGVVMKDSSISINRVFKRFTLALKVFQMETEGDQTFLQLKGDRKMVRIGLVNGKLFLETVKGGSTTERKLIDQELVHRDFIYFELVSNGSILKMSISSKDYSFPFFRVEGIVFGGGAQGELKATPFRGVINKILLIEDSKYNNCRIVNLEGSYLYIKVLNKLERYLQYHNLFGVYLDSIYPYFFNGKINLEFRNVL